MEIVEGEDGALAVTSLYMVIEKDQIYGGEAPLGFGKPGKERKLGRKAGKQLLADELLREYREKGQKEERPAEGGGF